MQVNEQHRSIGAIIGAAVGDALGMPTEGISERALLEQYGGRVTGYVAPLPSHPNAHLNSGQYTDDTQQILLLAESLVDKKRLDLVDFCGRFATWAKLNDAERQNGRKITHWRYPGATSLNAGLLLANGVSPEKSGCDYTSSCGSVMRVAPIGVFYRRNINDAMQYARLSSMPTHASDICKESAAFVAGTIAHLVKGVSPLEAVQVAKSRICSPALVERINHVVNICALDAQRATETLGLTSSAVDVVGVALYSFLHSPHDLRETVVTAVNAVPGDTDSFATVAGAFAGAHLGQYAIPLDWQMGIEDGVRIKRIAEDLYWTMPDEHVELAHRLGKDVTAQNEGGSQPNAGLW